MNRKEFIKAIKKYLSDNGHKDILKRMDKYDWNDCVQDVNFWIVYCGMTFESACALYVRSWAPLVNKEV